MPRSDTSNRPWVTRKIAELKPKTFLDIGAGEGTYGTLVKEHSPETVRHGVEIWAPYVKTYGLEDIYDKIYVCDARIFFDYKYDLVILGDVLEHMTRDDAVELWSKISSSARAAIISIPIIYLPQGEEEGNPYETHVKPDWTHEEVLSTFSYIEDYQVYQVTGSYLAKFRVSA